jgi:predicted transcriptional regulator
MLQQDRKNMLVSLQIIGTEWLFLLPLLIVIIIVIRTYLERRKRKKLESVILSLIRSRNGATLDDIIIGAYISSEDAHKYMQDLIVKNLIKVKEKDGKTIYMSA